jgi:endonuclease/exonuclease/phosphatase family metal-dependent hydrolase
MDALKIVSWNCRQDNFHKGTFDGKKAKILAYNPDVLVVLECEKQENSDTVQWYADNDDEVGICVFTFHGYKLERLPHNPAFRYVVPFHVTGNGKSFILFAVWAKVGKDTNYTEQVLGAISHYKLDELEHPIIFIGDFNSNHIWNNVYKRNDHEGIVQEFRKHAIDSVFHRFHSIDDERDFPTYFSNKNQEYHIDYCFASTTLQVKKAEDIEIGKHEEWKDYSDHCPLIVTFDFP